MSSDKNSGKFAIVSTVYQNRSKHTIVAESFQMIGGRSDEFGEQIATEESKKPENIQPEQVDEKQDAPIIPVELNGKTLIVDSIKYDIEEQKELDQLCTYFVGAKQKYSKQSLIEATNKILAIFEKQSSIIVQVDNEKILSKIDIIPF